MNRIGRMILMTSAQDRNRRNMDRSDYHDQFHWRLGPAWTGAKTRYRH